MLLLLVSLIKEFIVWQENGVVKPEIILDLHCVKNLLYVLVQMVAHRPNTHCATCRSQCQVPSVLRKLHLRYFKHRANLGSGNSSADLVHEDCVPGEIFLVGAERRGMRDAALHEIDRILVCKRWDLEDNVQARWINKATIRVERDLYGSSELSSVNPENVDATLARGDEQVVLTWVDIEASHLAFTNDVLAQR